MKPLDTYINAHLGDGNDGVNHITAFLLCELVGESATYRFTDAPIAIAWDGHTWLNVSFTISEMVADGEGELSCSVTFEDASKVIRAIAFAENLQDNSITVWEAWADPATNVVQGVDVIAQGITDGVRCMGEDTGIPTAVVTVRSVYGASGQAVGPTQEYLRNCRYFIFKGPQCKYAGGATSCDRLYSTCLTLANTINFGGFRFALDPGEKVQWGTNDPGYVPPRPSQPIDPYVPASGDVISPPPLLGRGAGRGR
jgi:hypothetical protein